MTILEQVPETPSVNDQVIVNELFETLSAAGIFGKRHEDTTGLTWGYYGGRYQGNTVSDGTVTLTDASDNYVVVLRSTGVVSTSTTDTNATNILYARLYKLTTAGGVVTVELDERHETNGLLAGTSLAASAVAITDAGTYFTGTDVEAALQELGADVAALGGGVTDGDKGDITVSGTGTVFTIDNDVVTNAKLANVSTQTIKGRTTASSGDPEDLTAAQAAAVVQGDGLDADACGFRGVPQNAQTGNYTLVAADAGKHIYHASGAGAGDTYTIPANSSVAFEIGTAVTFVNIATDSMSIAITTDTMNLAGTGLTGTRTLAQYGIATALKVTSTLWIVSGTGLS
jgi:hypothetical protein